MGIFGAVGAYIRRYFVKGRRRRNTAEYLLNTTILDIMRGWRRSWDHAGQHVLNAAEAVYSKAGALHWGDWYDEPTAPWAVDSAPWWSPVPIGAASTVVQ